MTRTSFFYCDRPQQRRGIALLCLLGLVTLLSLPAFAFKKDVVQKPAEPKARIENFEPPNATMLKDTCEPIRAQIVTLNNSVPKYAHLFIVPRREYLAAKLQRCKAKFMNQEYTYLKHVDVRKPELEKLPVQDESTSEPTESTTGDSKPASSEAGQEKTP